MTPISKILIVDDEPAILFLLEKLLAAQGHEVTTALSGDEAIHMSATRRFDLYLIDLIMPVKDGIETMLALRARHKKTPIIAMSGGWNGGKQSCLPLAGKLGACGTLAKPFDKAALLEAIELQVGKPRPVGKPLLALT